VIGRWQQPESLGNNHDEAEYMEHEHSSNNKGWWVVPMQIDAAIHVDLWIQGTEADRRQFNI